jgi:hypothetical protein
VRCDFCLREKGVVNHWLSVWISGPHFVVAPFDTEMKPDDHKDACGMNCATQALSRWMNTRTLEER